MPISLPAHYHGTTAKMNNETPIAVVGLSYRAPGIHRTGLWEFLAKAQSAWSKIPSDRFDADAYYYPDREKGGTIAAQGGHFLPGDIYSFDPHFFNLRAEEACAVDPHHRILLECALEAAESAGISLQDLAGSNTGVFSAIGSPEHGHMLGEDLPASSPWTCPGGAPTMFANRLSYFFDLTGPSVALDAACASSTYAIHIACQSLRSGECSSAFAGGSALLLGPGQWSFLDTMGALSPEGKSFSYDVKASGFGRGEGAACLLLKRLDDAIASGDPVHAIIRNSACNHGGRSDGITMPSRSAQEKLLLRVHREVGLNPNETPVVEGHGTGTNVGDPIEAGAFASVLASERTPDKPLYIGSLKSNFGHLEGASGALAIAKAIMMLQHGKILPNANFEKLNPKIEGRERLKVVTSETSWPADEARRAIVTNFGFGGSNAAIILEKAPKLPTRNGVAHAGEHNVHTKGIEHINGVHSLSSGVVSDPHGCSAWDSQNGQQHERPKRLFVLSAKSESSVAAYLSSFLEYLGDAPNTDQFMRDLCFTLGQRRTHHAHRIAVSANSLDTLKSQLSLAKSRKIKDRTLAWVFTGQGAQYAKMATGLQQFEVFNNAIEQAEKHLSSLGACWSLKEELGKPEDTTRVNEAQISQPACTALQLALVHLLRSWGVAPAQVTGHSSGEIAAAYAASLISFEAAVAIAYFRGQYALQLKQDKSQRGAMLALGIGNAEAEVLIKENTNGYATIAAINSPQSVTVSGDEPAVDNIHRLANTRGIFARKLRVDIAYHSQHMNSVAASYLEAIEPFCKNESPCLTSDRPTFLSSVTGSVIENDTLPASYWIDNLTKPVRFEDSIKNIFVARKGESSGRLPTVILEIGPHSALSGPIKQTVDFMRQQQSNEQKPDQFTYVASLVRGAADIEEAILNLSKNLFCLGIPMALSAVNLTNQHNAQVLTDLPAYAWDRSGPYILRSRITQAKLHPGQPYHPLLGWKNPDNQAGDISYRQVFTLDEIPWIRDHSVGGRVIFPFTGFLALALEAARRTTPAPPKHLLIQDFHAKRSLEIEEDERVDIVTKLTPTATGTETFSSDIWTFEVSTWSDGYGWTTHCHGRIEAQASEMTLSSQVIKASASLLDSDKLQERDPSLEYIPDIADGTHYGPAFKRMMRFWQGPGFTVMETELRDLDLSEPSRYGSPVSVDAPTLDSFLQGLGPLLEPYSSKKPAVMPNYVSRLRISNNIPLVEKLRMRVVTRLLDYDVVAGTIRVSVAAFVNGAISPVAEWESVTFRAIAAGDSQDSISSLPASYYWDLIPSLDHLADDEKLREILEAKPADENEYNRVKRLNKVGVHFMDQALRETAGDDLSQLPSHLACFRKWAATIVEKHSDLLSGVDIPALVAQVSGSGGQGAMVCAVGERLTSILRREIQPLEIMLKDDRLNKYYEDDMTNVRLSWILARWVRHLADIKFNLRVLEIGAGTGSATLAVFQELSRGEERLPDNFTYTYTDISAGFFEKAREKLAKWQKNITFKRLDISQDPVQQGFSLEDYDLVIASNCLHATPNMAATIDHVRSLLKPNGRLVLLEACRHAPLVLPFSLLPGWWLQEDEYRNIAEGPLLSDEGWSRLLVDRGFSGLDGVISGYPNDPENILNVITTTRVGKMEDRNDTAPITICGPLVDDEEAEFAQTVADMLGEQHGCEVFVKPFAEVSVEDDPYCVFIDSPRHSLFKKFSSETFELLKDFLLRIEGLLWVIPESHLPDCDTIKGLLRTVRLENGSRTMFMLENIPTSVDGASSIVQLTERLRDPELAKSADMDFTWKEGTLYLPRYRALTTAKEVFASEVGATFKKEQKFWQENTSFEMTVDNAGSPDAIYFKRTDILEQPVRNDEVLIKVEASGINFRDVLLVLGSIPWTRPGFEGAGVVQKVGSNVVDLKEGDRVFYGALEAGSIATHVKLPAYMACKIPAGFSSAEAAGISVAYSTAIMSLFDVGRLQKGESILIHAASGAVGQACIVLAQDIGAEVFVTAGSDKKRDFLHDTFSIPRDHIFSSRTPDFRDGILAITDGKGVDVIINSLSGNLLQETWAVIADFGRFVEIGKRDLLQNSYLGMRPFDRNVTFSGVDLRTRFLSRPQDHKTCLGELMNLLERGVIQPIRPVNTYPLSQLATGMRKLQSGQNIGKIIVTMDAEEQVMAEGPPLLATASGFLRHDVTYIITGGTGGIGLSIVPWMVENGARNIVLLGRSGATRPEVQKVLEQFKGSDVNVRAIACDVGRREDVVNALKAIEDLPAVGGAMHSALFLKDKLWENTSYEDWLNIVTPRNQGAWNLHELLPENMDFFVALSSFISGVGNVGQPVYSGTASFYDSFAEYRNSLGRPTVSIALPVVLGVGYVADRNLEASLSGSLGAVLSETHLRTVIKGAMIGASSGINRDGKAISYTYAQGDETSTLPWQCYHPRALVEYIRNESRMKGVAGDAQGGPTRSKTLQISNASDPLQFLLEVLMDKVSSITMIERDEIEAEAPLSNYSLDSLVSVELRNRIRRETTVDLPLSKIVSSGNLKALARYILSQRDATVKDK
ncbi:putative polyketide synthase [Xylariaceae sp. FL1272]|nr:putative polyketide synthase [Xylariaceae sp. FL1272]